MSVAKEIPELQTLVFNLLQKDKRLRNSDKKLSSRIWTLQIGSLEKLKAMTAYDFLVKYVDDESVLYSQESIGRCRRKLQELYPELRGEDYKKKQAEQGAVVSELRNMQDEIQDQKDLANAGLPEWEKQIREEECTQHWYEGGVCRNCGKVFVKTTLF